MDSLLCVSLANELIVEHKQDGLFEYQGASTDELALAYFSKQMGIELQGIDSEDCLTIRDTIH